MRVRCFVTMTSLTLKILYISAALLCVRGNSFSFADTVRLAWNAPGTLPSLQAGETLWYQLSQQRTPATSATPLVAVPFPTVQVAVTFPPLGTSERICWSLTLQKRNAAWQMMAESLAALGQVDPTTREVCQDGAKPELARTGWRVSADSSAAGYPASAALDATLLTFWHTPWAVTTVPPYPHQLTITLPQPVSLTEVRVTPRQDGKTGGIPRRWQVWVRDSALRWKVVASGTNASTVTPIVVTVPPVTTNAVRWRTLDALDGAPWASAADVALFGVLQPTGMRKR
jgi:hypothetical protein